MARAKDVVKLVRDGLGDTTSAARLREIIKILRRNEVSKGLTPEKLVALLEDLGPTFIKLGQILSSRSDMLPQEYCLALQSLRSSTTPEPVSYTHLDVYKRQGEGIVRAMRQALSEGGFALEDVGHLNAHGTSTHANDATESAALRVLLGEKGREVPVTSIKGTVGHTLGAAGALEAIVCALSVSESVVPPTVGTTQVDPECGVNVVTGRALEGCEQKVALRCV